MRINVVAIAVVLLGLFPAGAKGAGFEPRKGSPIAWDKKSLFCIDSSQKRLLAAAMEDPKATPKWLPMKGIELTRLTSIAYRRLDDTLGLVDEATGIIHLFSLQTRELSPLAKLTPSQVKGSVLLATDRGYLLGSPATQQVQAIVDGRLKSLNPELPFTSGAGLAAGKNTILVTQPDEGRVLIHDSFGSRAKLRVVSEEGLVSHALPTTVTRALNAPVTAWRPSAVAESAEIAYVADRDGRLMIFAVYAPHPLNVPIASPPPLSSLVVVGDSLIGMPAEGTAPVVIERHVPVELSLVEATAASSKAASEMLFELFKAGGLPAVTVDPSVSSKSFSATLRKDAGVGAMELNTLFCSMNRPACSGTHGAALDGGVPLRFPVLVEETFIDTKVFAVDGTRVAALLEASIPNPTLGHWKEPDQLARINPRMKPATAFHDLKKGSIRLPYQRVRYLMVVGSAAARALEHQKSSGFTLSSQERFPTKAEASLVGPAARARLEAAWANLLKTISWPPSARSTSGGSPVWVTVAIAENAGDWINSAVGAVVTPLEKFGEPAPEPFVVSAPPEQLTALDSCDLANDHDHGTMVASMLAAPSSQYDGGLGLIPNVRLKLLNPSYLDRQIQESRAYPIELFNVSRSFGASAGAAVREISASREALFVIAAGNQGDPLGLGSPHLLANLGDLDNVIVVGATNADGRSLLAAGEKLQTNYGAPYVSLVAPGEGFYVPARGFNHCPAVGTSFAAPQVTAAAAVLIAASEMSAQKVKQRLVYTADPFIDDSKVQGGKLNLARALYDWKHDLVCLTATQSCAPGTSDYEPREIRQNYSVTFTSRTASAPLQFHIANLRRLTRKSNGDFRVVYEASPGPPPAGQTLATRLLRVDDVRADPRVKLNLLNGPAIPMTDIDDYVGRSR